MRVQACLRARDDGDSNFHPCGSPVRLVQPCLCAANPDKAVFTTEEVLRTRAGMFMCQGRSRMQFHHCGSFVRLVQACLCVVMT